MFKHLRVTFCHLDMSRSVQKCHSLVLLGVAGLLLSAAHGVGAAALPDEQAFSQFKQQQTQQFSDYVRSQKEAFALYQKEIQQAFSQYRQEILKYWSKAEVSTPKKWVHYSPNYQQKTVIDAEKNEVTIVQLADRQSPEALEKQKMQAFKKLEQLQGLTYQKALAADPVQKTVEATLRKRVVPSLVKSKANLNQRVPLVGSHIDRNNVTIEQTNVKGKKAVVLHYKLPESAIKQRVKSVLPWVQQQAQRYQLSPAFILAFIKNESAFNPLATSYIPAYGLMQIVPTSAGKDATAFLFGQPKVLAPSYLYTPDKNIEIGVTYLHILNRRYLKAIKNSQSRLLCTIAAYNTGAGNVAKAYTGRYRISEAAKRINQQTPAEVYHYLLKHLPYAETQHYLKKVYRDYQNYQKMFES